MKTRIFYTKPSITNLEINYATDAAANGWGDSCYEYIYRFEELFKQHLGVEYAIATSSCTGALHMGLVALDIRPGDEVILADTNWIATASPITYLGAKPILVDIIPDSWCIDPIKVEQAITQKTKAIIATHLYGNLCEMSSLLAIGEKYGIPIIEDSAEAIGSVYYGKRAGSMGKFGVFSFHGSKTLTTGEGGMFVTNDLELYERVLTLNNHGRIKGQNKQFWPDLIGFKYKISNIQAAIGCAQMERIDELINRKIEILRFYRESLIGLTSTITINPEPSQCVNGAWMPTIVFSRETGVTRESIQVVFRKENIDARVFFWPLSSLPMFESKNNLVAWDIPTRSINLPSYHDITIEELSRICELVLFMVNK